jgi:hypothetical protein
MPRIYADLGWTEERPLPNNARCWTKEGISNIRSELPFPLYGNGGDLSIRGSRTGVPGTASPRPGVALTARTTIASPDRKTAIGIYAALCAKRRAISGLTPRRQKALAEVYRCLCPLNNYRYPSIKIIGKIKLENGRYKKSYDKPKTPCQRLLESSDVSEERRAGLRRRRDLYNPVVMKQAMDIARDCLLQLNSEKCSMIHRPGGWGKPLTACFRLDFSY